MGAFLSVLVVLSKGFTPLSKKELDRSVFLAMDLLPGEENRSKIEKVSDKADDMFPKHQSNSGGVLLGINSNYYYLE